MPDIRREQLRAFAQDGYIVVSQVVSSGLVDAARRAIADRVSHDPPRAGHRGPHFDFVVGHLPRDLVAPLFDCATLALAESLIAPGSFERPDHVQVSLNIPPWPHQPGGSHIDGLTPPETDGRPGTFTMLAGIFLTDRAARTQAIYGSGLDRIWRLPTPRDSTGRMRSCRACRIRQSSSGNRAR